VISNSTSGLTVLAPERDVTVVEEEHHQDVLARWAPEPGGAPRPIVVELQQAPVARGTYAGRPGIEVLIRGRRVGALTFRMAQRYGPVVDQVVRRGERPGANATVKHGRRGLVEVELKLPAVGTLPPVPAPVPDIPEQRGGGGPVPPAARKRRAPLWIGGGIGAVLVLAGVIGGTNSGDRSAPTAPAAVVASTAPAAPASAVVPGTIAPVTVAPVTVAPVPAVVDPPKIETPEVQTPKVETPRIETPKIETKAPTRPAAVDPEPAPAAAYYKNCTEARKAGVTPILRGQPGYSAKLDRDGDGIACE
jgi:hypothetical protein